MLIIPFFDILETCTDLSNFSQDKLIFDLIYNQKNTICFSRNYIELIETSISNKDAFQSLIVELNDQNRLLISKVKPSNSIESEFIEIASKEQIPLLFPLILKNNSDITTKINFVTILNDLKLKSRNWLIVELLTKRICNLSYLDFKNQTELLEFINVIFSVPNIIKEVCIFNREQDISFLKTLKGKHVKYYTLLNYKTSYHEKQSLKKDLQRNISGKLKLYYTSDKRILHERKIIFEDIIVTIDNSFNNLEVKEPTWEIIITVNNNKAEEWKKKCETFHEVK